MCHGVGIAGDSFPLPDFISSTLFIVQVNFSLDQRIQFNFFLGLVEF